MLKKSLYKSCLLQPDNLRRYFPLYNARALAISYIIMGHQPLIMPLAGYLG